MKEVKLQDLRDKIKEVDREIVRLLEQRAGIAVEVGRIKAELGMEVYHPFQEEGIYENAVRASSRTLPEKSLRAIFREIVSASRALQRPVTIAYLGPEASFAHLAAQTHFGQSSQFFPQSSIARVFEEVERKKVQWGVVPLENSIEGSVNLTLDKLITTTLCIRTEIFLPVTHCLLSLHERLEDIEKVYSHPQALAQCQGWLRLNLSRAALIEMESTARAAQRVKQERNGAAIGSKAAAAQYGLILLEERIEDNHHNTTRFLVLGETEGRPTGKDKTSLIFATSHTPGALHAALQPFADRQVNLMKIESYPVKDRLWEYLFFVDVAGHREDETVKQCLDELKRRATFLKILGSYSVSGGIP